MFALGHRRQAAGEIGELADVIPRDSLIRVRLVVVRGGMMSRPYVEERIKQPRKVAAQAARWRPWSCRSETPAR